MNRINGKTDCMIVETRHVPTLQLVVPEWLNVLYKLVYFSVTLFMDLTLYFFCGS